MATRGKPLTFSTEEIDDLAGTPYANKRTFPLLALMFPHVDTRNAFHVDHVFPRALFKKTTLVQAGVPAERIGRFMELVNNLPNLQLLEGPINMEKQAQLPLAWATKKFTEPGALEHYLERQDLAGLPPSLVDFANLYELRRKRLADRLRRLLGVEATALLEPVSSPNVASRKPEEGNTYQLELATSYNAFFSTLLTELASKGDFPFHPWTPRGQRWAVVILNPAQGTKDSAFVYSFAVGKRLRAELYFAPGYDRNKSLASALYNQKEAIEAEVGEPLSWENMGGDGASRVALYHYAGSIRAGKADEAGLRAWAIGAMIRLYGALASRLERL